MMSKPCAETLKNRLDDAMLLADEAKYCSFGDTVHYVNPPKIFDGCEGSYMYDKNNTPYLDLQMWYSACNFGYANERLNSVLKKQIDTLPQCASQYLHPTKIELAKTIALDMKQKFGRDGRVHFNVGGSQCIEDSLKIIRNASNGKTLMFAFEGGYHGRTLGASSITSSFRYRRRYGHFGDRAMFIPFPYPFRRPKGMTAEEYGEHLVADFARLFETEYHGVWDPKAGQAEYAAFYVEPLQGTGGYIVPPKNYFKGLKKVLETLEQRHQEIGEVDGLGLALRAEICTEDGFTPNKALVDKMVDIGMSGDLDWNGQKMGLVLDIGGYYKNVITFAPSLHISKQEIDQGIELLDQLITRAKKELNA